MKRILLSVVAVLVSVAVDARVELTPLFTDNMVFQQNCQAPVWGKAAPGTTVSVIPSWNRKTYRTTAGPDGKWLLKIDTPSGSFKPYTLTISDGEPIVLQNVMVGQVWLASGQSNMQMPVESWREVRTNQEDIANAARYSELRLLQVARATGMKEHDYFSADFDKWKESSPESVRNFSAAAWYFGRKLMEELKVPVGIIHASWGGTIIEAWMSEGTISLYPEMAESLEKVKSLSDNESAREKTFEEEIEDFTRKAGAKDSGKSGDVALWARPGLDDTSWKTIRLPSKVQELWPSTNGIYWFRKTVEIPAGWAGKDLTLSLGPVDDMDETYWNGELVGAGRLWNKAREYIIPSRLVKGGKAVITIRCTDDHGDGGLYGSPDLLFVQAPDGESVRLDGEWKVTLSVSFEGMPKSTAREPNMPTVLYNAMIRPLAPFAIKGAIWYQGESNAERAYRYRDLMPSMIRDWRSLWGYDFPFYITQLAGYKAVSDTPGDDSWAELREAQQMATRSVDKCGMACIIDLGEAEDVHPVRKREVGERLSRLALANDYGKQTVPNGPRFESYKIRNGAIVITFSDVAEGLRIIPSGPFAGERYGTRNERVDKAESGALSGFQIAGPDRVWHWADARIEGNRVVVWSQDVPQPLAVRYAWSVNPVCNLFNSEGLPAWPFRTDDWPGVTCGKN